MTMCPAIPLGMTGVTFSGSSFIGGNANSVALSDFQEFGELSTADAAIVYLDVLSAEGNGSGLSAVISLAERTAVGRDPYIVTTAAFVTPAANSFSAITGVTTNVQRLVIEPVYGIIHQLQATFTGISVRTPTAPTVAIPIASIGASTVIALASSTGIANGDLLRISDNIGSMPELVKITALSGLNATCTRGMYNTFNNGWGITGGTVTTITPVQGYVINCSVQSIHRN